MKVRKKFEYEGIELRIVDVEEQECYPNYTRTWTSTRVIAPNGGFIPMQIQSRQTLKSIAEETIKTLNNFKSLGADVKTILTLSKK